MSHRRTCPGCGCDDDGGGDPDVYWMAIRCCLRGDGQDVAFVASDFRCPDGSMPGIVRYSPDNDECYTVLNGEGAPLFVECELDQPPPDLPDGVYCLPDEWLGLPGALLFCEAACDSDDCRPCDDDGPPTCCEVDRSCRRVPGEWTAHGNVTSRSVIEDCSCLREALAYSARSKSSTQPGGVCSQTMPYDEEDTGQYAGCVTIPIEAGLGGSDCLRDDTCQIYTGDVGGFRYDNGVPPGQLFNGAFVYARAQAGFCSIQVLSSLQDDRFAVWMTHALVGSDISATGSASIIRGGPCQPVVGVAFRVTFATDCGDFVGTAKADGVLWFSTSKVAHCPNGFAGGPTARTIRIDEGGQRQLSGRGRRRRETRFGAGDLF